MHLWLLIAIQISLLHCYLAIEPDTILVLQIDTYSKNGDRYVKSSNYKGIVNNKLFKCCNLHKILISSTNISSLKKRRINHMLTRLNCGYGFWTPEIYCQTLEPFAVNKTETTTTASDGFLPVDGVISSTPQPETAEDKKINYKDFGCGVSTENRVSNGNRTKLFELPWMALISYDTRDGLEFLCGGTIINERYILTAAHCITDLIDKTLAGVRVGEQDISMEEDCEGPPDGRYCAQPVQDVEIEKVIPHPDYENKLNNHDIGLVRLKTPIVYNEKVMPICLPSMTESRLDLVGQKATAAGWGITETGRNSDILLKISLPIISNDECIEAYTRSLRPGITLSQICAGGEFGYNTCEADSGGPLMILGVDTNRVTQYGIVSLGSGRCSQTTLPGVYTRVGHYVDWILDNIEKREA